MDENVEGALKLVPYGMYVIGSGSGDEVNGMTANWVTQCSFSPRLVAVAIKQAAHTRGLIDRGGHFTVNVVADGDLDLLKLFVKPQRRTGAKFGDDVGFREASAGAPILDAAIAWVECRVVAGHDDGGDHVLFVGEVIDGGVQHEGAPFLIRDTGWNYAG